MIDVNFINQTSHINFEKKKQLNSKKPGKEFATRCAISIVQLHLPVVTGVAMLAETSVSGGVETSVVMGYHVHEETEEHSL